MAHLPFFKQILVEDICSLNSGWKISYEDMIKIAIEISNLSNFSEKYKIILAKKFFYSSSIQNNLERINTVISIIQSIKKNGYNFDLIKNGHLPRLFLKDNKLCINDGRHRLIALRALGVKHFPIILVEIICKDVDGNNVKQYYNKLNQETNKNILIFLNSKKWKQYQNTIDYQLAFERI
jgi:hypothetical protein